jgi:hypothetical protein
MARRASREEDSTMATKKQTAHKDDLGHQLKGMATEGHKAARVARKADSLVYETEVLASGNPKRIRRYFFRKIAYKLFGKFMGKAMKHV